MIYNNITQFYYLKLFYGNVLQMPMKKEKLHYTFKKEVKSKRYFIYKKKGEKYFVYYNIHFFLIFFLSN